MNKKQMIAKIKRLEEIVQSQCEHDFEYESKNSSKYYGSWAHSLATYQFKCTKCGCTTFVNTIDKIKLIKEKEVKKAKKTLEEYGYEIKD